MATIPRFTGGRLGPVGYADMNRVMAATEIVESLDSVQAPVSDRPRPLFAKITGPAPIGGPTWTGSELMYQWVEVLPSHSEPAAPWDWVTFSGNLSSTSFVGGDAYAISSSSLATGTIVELRRVSALVGDAAPLGRTWFIAIPIGGAAQTAAGIVLAEQNGVGALGLNGYTVTTFSESGGWTTPTGPSVFAVNDYEYSAALQTQVQTQSPGTKTLLRLPPNTRTGPMRLLPIVHSPPIWVFSVANAYQVVC